MRSKPILVYISFGTAFRFLNDANGGTPVYGDGWVIENIKRFFSLLKEFDLPVTERASWELKTFHTKMLKKVKNHRLTSVEAKELKDIISGIRKTLFAEAKGKVAFIVNDKRYDVNKLLGDVRSLMAPGIFEKLPGVAKYDLEEAGKCIAFEHPTAAAFHILRGTESVLRNYYCSIVKRSRVNPLLWGAIVTSLRSRRSFQSATLLNHLDNIRLSFRNPTQHPEKIYDIQEGQDLFGVCIDVVN